MYRTNDIIVNDAKSYIDGLLLSDGSLVLRNLTGYYEQTCKNGFWLDKIRKDFLEFGILSNAEERYIGDRFIKNAFTKGNVYYRLRTLFYVEFASMRYRWYPEGIKVVPDDIIMSPECVGNWYMGDGSISRVKPNGYSIGLATYGFERKNVDFLSEILNETLCINSYVCKNNVIKIGNIDCIKVFIDYIKGCCVYGYEYKFPMELT